MLFQEPPNQYIGTYINTYVCILAFIDDLLPYTIFSPHTKTAFNFPPSCAILISPYFLYTQEVLSSLHGREVLSLPCFVISLFVYLIVIIDIIRLSTRRLVKKIQLIHRSKFLHRLIYNTSVCRTHLVVS